MTWGVERWLDSDPEGLGRALWICMLFTGGLAMLGLCCCAWSFSQLLFITAASLVAEHRLQGVRASLAVVHRLRCPEACGIFLDQGSNPALAEADS